MELRSSTLVVRWTLVVTVRSSLTKTRRRTWNTR